MREVLRCRNAFGGAFCSLSWRSFQLSCPCSRSKLLCDVPFHVGGTADNLLACLAPLVLGSLVAMLQDHLSLVTATVSSLESSLRQKIGHAPPVLSAVRISFRYSTRFPPSTHDVERIMKSSYGFYALCLQLVGACLPLLPSSVRAESPRSRSESPRSPARPCITTH